MLIKIQCPCGSKYSFEVDPVEGRMPVTVHCPACNADGTGIANQLLSEQAAKPAIRILAAAPAPVAAQPAPILQIPPRGAAMEKMREQRRQFRTFYWIAAAVALVIAALVAGWTWFAWVGSKPALAWSVTVPGPSEALRTGFMAPGVMLMVAPDHATARDLNKAKDLWSVSFAGKEAPEYSAPQVFLDKDSIWICLHARVLRLNRATGEVKSTIPIEGDLQSFTPSATNLLIVSALDETTRKVCRIDTASGEFSTEKIEVPRSQLHEMPNDLPPNVLPTAGVLLSQALEDQRFNKPLNAVSSEFFSTGPNLVELRVKLLEPKVTYVQSMKPRGPTHITSKLTASSSAADVAEELSNDLKRDRTGGVKGVDESRYEVLLRRWIGAAPDEWKTEVTGVPMFFSLNSVDLLVAGKHLVVFDKQNQKLFDATLAYPLGESFNSGFGDRHSVPAIEGNGALFFYDAAVLTAFSLPSGAVRWRLPTVGVSAAQFDDKGALYVNSTTASPEDIQYSDQVKLNQPSPVLLKINPASGKILWQVAGQAQACYLSGPFLYVSTAQRGGIGLARGLAEGLNAPEPEAPVYFHLYRLDPADGRQLWDFYREEAPAEMAFQQNRFLLRFGSRVELWKFLTF
jgi:hypothetical protein